LTRVWAAFCIGFSALALGLLPGLAGAQEAPDFGSPPSGSYPIIFNDHHVYSRPDVDREGRVLSALVRGNTILVPLRSMFEQMGAVVSYDDQTKTAIVSKPGSEIRVTVGKPEVEINGETRPLDVPPEIYQGVVLVPVRVISEAMGAYVQWLQDKHVVVVRYVPAPAPTSAPAPPPPAPTATPAPASTLPPAAPIGTPVPVVTPFLDKFLVGDVLDNTLVYNEFTNGNQSNLSYNIRGAFELSFPIMHVMFDGDLNRWQFSHDAGNVNILGNGTATAVPYFIGREDDLNVNLGIRVAQPRIYFIEGYYWGGNNWGYPPVHGLGYGLEKLPDLNQPLSITARFWYSSSVKGPFGPNTVMATTYPAGTVSYRVYQTLIGGDWDCCNHIFVDFGFQAQKWDAIANAPASRYEDGPYLGLGVRF